MELGRRIGETVPENRVIALEGDLGAGKTTLTKGIGSIFGINPNAITSPTFNLYSIHQGIRQLIHIDGYRLEGGNANDDLLIEEFLNPPWLIVVEWPERGLADWMISYAVKLKLCRSESDSSLLVSIV